MQGSHDCGDALPALAQLGVEDALGGIVDDGDEGEPPLGRQGEPVMAAAIEMQQFAKAGVGLAAAAMAAARLLFRDEAGRLQDLLHEGVAEAHAVLPAGEPIEVADIEALVPVPVEGEHALDSGDRRALGRRGPPPSVEQAVIAIVLEPPAHAANTAGAAAQDVGGLLPGELPAQGSDNDFLHLHSTLHCRRRIGHGHLLGVHCFHGAR